MHRYAEKKRERREKEKAHKQELQQQRKAEVSKAWSCSQGNPGPTLAGARPTPPAPSPVGSNPPHPGRGAHGDHERGGKGAVAGGQSAAHPGQEAGGRGEAETLADGARRAGGTGGRPSRGGARNGMLHVCTRARHASHRERALAAVHHHARSHASSPVHVRTRTCSHKHCCACPSRMCQALEQGQRILIDCSFEDMMTDTELRSLCQQLAYSYHANSRASPPVHLILTGIAGRMRDVLRRQCSGLENWIVTCEEGDYLQAFAAEKDNLVYLTADSNDEIQEVCRRGRGRRCPGTTWGEEGPGNGGRGPGRQTASEPGTQPAPQERRPDGHTPVLASRRSRPHAAHMQLDPAKIYIVGGIVDRNRHKRLCADKAESQARPCTCMTGQSGAAGARRPAA